MGPLKQSSYSFGRIGPNAVIQLGAVLAHRVGRRETARLAAMAGHIGIFDNLLTEMVDERVPAALFSTLYAEYPPEFADMIATEAGVRTADYVIENRIPAVIRRVLRWLPPSVSGPVLLRAIDKNAWTFVGSGSCRVTNAPKPMIGITDNPLRMPNHAWHRGVFKRMFRRLVCARATIECDDETTAEGVRTTFSPCYGSQRLGFRCSRQSTALGQAMCINCIESGNI